MSMINKMAKYGAVTPLPNGGNGRVVGESRLLGPPGRGFGGYGGMMGDPGIFGSIFKGIKSIAGIGTGIVSKLGIPVISGVAGGLSGILSGRAGIPGASTQPIYRLPAPIPMAPLRMPGSGIPTQYGLAQMQQPVPGFAGAMQRLVPGGATGMMPPPSASMGGYHLNKSSYFLMDGTFIEAGTKWVKNRRRNPGNMRALSRSLGRVKSAKRMAKALSNVTIKKTCPA